MHKGKVLLLGEVDSTQDAAIAHELQHGDVCVSFNQTAGRGRRRNTWDGTGGVAVTVVLDSIQPHLPIAVAATLAAQLNNLIPHATVGIKWPNDLLVNGKKLAGVLIEQREGRYLVGIGVNVLSSPLPTSTALNDIGAETNLETVAELVSSSVFDASQIDENTAVTSWLDIPSIASQLGLHLGEREMFSWVRCKVFALAKIWLRAWCFGLTLVIT